MLVTFTEKSDFDAPVVVESKAVLRVGAIIAVKGGAPVEATPESVRVLGVKSSKVALAPPPVVGPDGTWIAMADGSTVYVAEPFPLVLMSLRAAGRMEAALIQPERVQSFEGDPDIAAGPGFERFEEKAGLALFEEAAAALSAKAAAVKGALDVFKLFVERMASKP